MKATLKALLSETIRRPTVVTIDDPYIADDKSMEDEDCISFERNVHCLVDALHAIGYQLVMCTYYYGPNGEPLSYLHVNGGPFLADALPDIAALAERRKPAA